jgi:signal transduction histidine kinase
MRRARISSCLTILAILGIAHRANAIDADARRAVVESSDRAIRPAVTNITIAVHNEIAEPSVTAKISGRQLSADAFHTRSTAPQWTQYFWFFLVLLLAVFSQSLLVAGFLAQRAKRRRAEEALRLRDTALRRSSERIGQLAGQLINAQETVRTHIARDLHDDVAQRLSLLAIDLSMLQLQVDQWPSSAQQRIGEMSSRAAEIGSDLHRLSHELHPALLEELGLEAAIRSFCRELSSARHLDIDLRVRDLPHPVKRDVALCIYRVVQEALQNVARHSGASSASIAIERAEDDLILTVIDHGTGFDVHEAHEKDSLGLRSIEERVNLLDGELAVRSQKGEGTRLEARVPLQPLASAAAMSVRPQVREIWHPRPSL